MFVHVLSMHTSVLCMCPGGFCGCWVCVYVVYVCVANDCVCVCVCLYVHVCLGTFTVLSIMVGSVTERLAPDQYFLVLNGTNLTGEVNIQARDAYRVSIAATTTILGGAIQVSTAT